MLNPDDEPSLETEKLLPLAAIDPDKAPNQTLALYIKHNPGVELQLAYAEPLDGMRNIFQVLRHSRNKSFPSSSPSPLFGIIGLGIFLLTVLACTIADSNRSPITHVFAGMTLMTLATVSVIVTSNFLNFRLLYGPEWLHVMLGPTHVGLSRESMKLAWIGKFFSSYSVIVGWNEILSLDACRWSLTDGKLDPKLRIKHKSLPGYDTSETAFSLTLSGFRDADECRLFLTELDRNVPDDRKSDLFRSLIKDLDPVIAQLQFAQSISEEEPPRLVSNDT
jgi:hypothetical protein